MEDECRKVTRREREIYVGTSRTNVFGERERDKEDKRGPRGDRD